VKLDELILKFLWQFKGPRIAKAVLAKKAGELALWDFETNYRATVIRPDGEDTNIPTEQGRRIYKQNSRRCPRRSMQILKVEQQWLSITVEENGLLHAWFWNN